MIEVGRVCVKIAGRDAGKKGAIVELIDDNFVIIDGQMKRGKANIRHIEPLQHRLELESGAAHELVVDALKAIGVEFAEKKKFARKAKEAKTAAPKKAEKAKPAKPKAEKAAKKEQK
jgi:large subunit ribosomal protein L14e